MFRKLLFLGATVWLGKKGFDALMASQTNVADFVDTDPAYSTDITDANDESAPLRSVPDQAVAAQLQDVKLRAAEVNDPA